MPTLAELNVAFWWAFNRRRFYFGFCVGWSLALILNTIFILVLHLWGR